ncbi:TIGR04282 family arsenosugar biosynthesis glycosyltransferase [Candidatus Omnitrophota bacterium]
MSRCLIVFAKEPKKDQVKTRLSGELSAQQRLNLYQAFLKDTLSLALSFPCEERILAYQSKSRPVYLERLARGFKLYKQRGENLGQKMHHAFQFAQKNQAKKIVIIGSDAPTLPAKLIKQAFSRLNTKDLVLGPCLDGGYYLIGLSRPVSGLFKDITWSSDRVLAQTVNNARRLHKRVALLDAWYDVDDSSGLTRLKHDLKKDRFKHCARSSRKFLKIKEQD